MVGENFFSYVRKFGQIPLLELFPCSLNLSLKQSIIHTSLADLPRNTYFLTIALFLETLYPLGA
jgi:hypothetical protein